MFCNNCGKEIEDSSIYCPSCGANVNKAPGSTKSAKPEKSNIELTLPKTLPLGLLIIIIGASLMLIALSQDWYSVHFAGVDGQYIEKGNLAFGDLMDSEAQDAGLNWFGIALPPILLIIFASTAILSAFYSIFTGQQLKRLFHWLCLLSVAALTANFLYIFSTMLALNTGGQDIVPYTTPHVGSVLIFIGALAIGVGNRLSINLGSGKV